MNELARTLPAVSNAQLLAAFIQNQRSPQTQKAYRADLVEFGKFAGAATVLEGVEGLIKAGHGNATMIAMRWRESMVQSKLAPATVNRRLAALRAMIQMAKMFDMVTWNLDVKNVKAEQYKDTRGPGEDGFKKMCAFAAKHPNKKKAARDYAILWLLMGQGMRRFEVAGLELEHVELDQNRISILGKGRSEREYISLAPQAHGALKVWIAWRGKHDGPVFSALDHAANNQEPLTGKSVWKIVSTIGHAVGLTTWPHALRHTAITSGLDATNGDVRAVASFARHKNIQTTMRYDDNRRDIGGDVAKKIGERVK